MAWVQSSTVAQVNAASSISVSFGSTPGSGSGRLCIVTVDEWNGGTPTGPTGYTDNQSPPNTYTEHIEGTDYYKQRAGLASAPIATASGTFTVTVNLTDTASWGGLSIHEYSGMNTSSSRCSTSNSNYAVMALGGGTYTGPTISPATNATNVAFLSHDNIERTLTPDAAWTQRAEQEASSAGEPQNVMEKIGAGSQTPVWTYGSATSTANAIAVVGAFTPLSTERSPWPRKTKLRPGIFAPGIAQ